MLSTDNINTHLWILNPDSYKTLAAPDQETGMLEPAKAYYFIPPILSLVQLKRTAATVIDNVPGKGAYRIGAEITPVRWINLKLQMRGHKIREYSRIHYIYTRGLGIEFDDVADSPLRNMAYQRKLCLTVMTPDMDKVSSSDEGPKVIEKFYHKNNDHGATYYVNCTKQIAVAAEQQDTSLDRARAFARRH